MPLLLSRTASSSDWYSLHTHGGIARLSWPRWLVSLTEINFRPRESLTQTWSPIYQKVRAYRATSLIRQTQLPTTPNRHQSAHYSISTFWVLSLVQIADPDKTRQDCLVYDLSNCRRCEQNRRQVNTVFSSPHHISRLAKTVSKFSVADSLDLSPNFVHIADKTR